MSNHTITTGTVNCGDVSLFYQDEGNIQDPPILLIMGLGAQLIHWPDEFVSMLIASGFRVIRFDNRDSGLSDKSNFGVKISLTKAAIQSKLGMRIINNYNLYDMVRDTTYLLDKLGIAKIHLVGASMGGMIAQLFAAIYPHRTLSLTSIMSSTNEKGSTRPRMDVMLNLAGYGVEKGHDKDTVIRRSSAFIKKISSPAYPTSNEEITSFLDRAYDRAYRPGGQLRQSHAILSTGGFRHLLKKIDTPTLIIHGDSDPLVNVKGGIASAKAVRNSQLEIIKGMGHDLPRQLHHHLIKKINENAAKAIF